MPLDASIVDQMTRPLRLEFAGALYHVTSRGDRRESIYRDDTDYLVWFEMLGLACRRHNFVIHSFCQMPNHYHLLIETLDANLSQGMRQLNSQYSQFFNRRHSVVGHLFQGRYKAILVQKESYLFELSRYVVLNPLRARLIDTLADWKWSSYPYVMGRYPAPEWLNVDWVLGQFDMIRSKAVLAYADFVAAGKGAESPLINTRNQLLLGNEDFVSTHQQPQRLAFREISRAQRRSQALSLSEYQQKFPNRHQAMVQAYLSTAFSMAQIAAHFNVSYRTVSRAVAKFEASAST